MYTLHILFLLIGNQLCYELAIPADTHSTAKYIWLPSVSVAE
jgi:hypothetical protein